MRRIFILFLVSNLYFKLFSQGNILELTDNSQIQLAQLDIQSDDYVEQHSSLKPYYQHRILKSFNINPSLLRDNYEYYRMMGDSMENLKSKKFLKYFYNFPGHAYSYYNKNYYFCIDPLLDIQGGGQKNSSDPLIQNTRGLSLKAGIDQKVFLFSRIYENQVNPLEHINEYALLYKAYPGGGFIKSYKSKVFKINNGYDYLIAEGGINFRASRHIDISFAHSRYFIGQGIRSLLLSDFSAPQLNLRINTYLGRWNYQNIFSELSSETRFINDRDQLLLKKYAATHYLSCNITSNWNLGIFESVIFNRRKGFELQYLNPIILYRAVEQAVGSPDNVLIGLNSHLDLAKKVRLYGQVMLDEFVTRQLLKNKGWWANKYGFQIGFIYPELAGIRNLSLQYEFNAVRPYTYSYTDSLTNYSHYNQSLAHPLGSNFHESIGRLTYDINSRLNLQLSVLYYAKGIDNDTLNWGGNILKPNATRVQDNNNKTLQGEETRVALFSLNTSYELFPRFYIDLQLATRNLKNSNVTNRNSWIQLGVRMNVNSSRRYEL